MAITLTVLWRSGLALILVVAIVASACARAPRRRAAREELAQLVAAALALYAAGALAVFTHHDILAVLVTGAGIAIAALAAWMSRGAGGEDPPTAHEPTEEQPPPEPDGLPHLDWPSFERAFRDYARQSGTRSSHPKPDHEPTRPG
jgi:hypothetical protein